MNIADYHQRTKHLPAAYAKGPESIDWDAQPDPFRRYEGATELNLPLLPVPLTEGQSWAQCWQDNTEQRAPLRTLADIAHVLELSLALSAWKQYGSARWSLRINPSSGNLHPTEAYVLLANIQGLDSGVYHYRADRHGLELRCRFTSAWPDTRPAVLLALTSVPWREAWKYGERAFRYCQHDTGHALAAISFAYQALNFDSTALNYLAATDDQIRLLTGINRMQDFLQAEAELPDVLLTLSGDYELGFFIDAALHGEWQGRASVLDPRHFYQWPVIDEAAEACDIQHPVLAVRADCATPALPATGAFSDQRAAQIFRQRRSAQAFDTQGAMRAQDFFTLLDHCLPRQHPPWNALPVNQGLHLFLFVHNVEGLDGGLYCLLRDKQALDELKPQLRDQFVWQAVDTQTAGLPLYLLLKAGTRRTAANLSCQQAIAGDSAFSLAMLADMRPLASAPWHYRHLLWQAGAIGQILYLEAESCGLRGTGIGCFYDDHVHQLLGLTNNDWQVLYHFTVGLPLVDHRVTSWSPYREREG